MTQQSAEPIVLVASVDELLQLIPVAKAYPYTPKSKLKFDFAGMNNTNVGTAASAGTDAVLCTCRYWSLALLLIPDMPYNVPALALITPLAATAVVA